MQITLDMALNDPDPLSFDARPTRGPALTARITCRVCERPAAVPILSSGLLCDLCRADLDATERHICARLAAAEQTLHDAWDTWHADHAAATERDQARYAAVCAAQAAPDYAARYQATLALGDGLSALLKSAERAEAALGAMKQVQTWANAALEEVRAAR